MIAMRMMHPSTHDIIDMIAMGYGIVPTIWAMDVTAPDFRGAANRGSGAHLYYVLVNMIVLYVMQMTVMEIINMPFMANRQMPAVLSMFMLMRGMLLLGICHGTSPTTNSALTVVTTV